MSRNIYKIGWKKYSVETLTTTQTNINGTPKEIAEELAILLKQLQGVEGKDTQPDKPVILSGFAIAHQIKKTEKDRKKHSKMNKNQSMCNFEAGNTPYIYFPDIMDITTAAFYMGVKESAIKKWIYTDKYLEAIYIDTTARVEKVKLDVLRYKHIKKRDNNDSTSLQLVK